MNKSQIPIRDTLSELALPFILKGICCISMKIISLSSENLFASHLSSPLRWIDQIISYALNDYICFINMNLILRVVKNLIGKTYKNYFDLHHVNIKQEITYLSKLIICYSVMFACYQFIFILPSPFNIILGSETQIPQSPESYLAHYQLSRNLDQVLSKEEDEVQEEKLILSPQLNPGVILGSIPKDDLSIVLTEYMISRDGNSFFVLDQSTLSIFNISNPKKVQKKSELALGTDDFWKTILQSPDERSLFILSPYYLSVIDISDLASPKLIWNKQYKKIESMIFSMTVSLDGTTLYLIRDLKFQIYNITNPSSPKLLYQESSNIGTTIAVSDDNSRVAIGFEEGFDIYDVSNPKKPAIISSYEHLDGGLSSIAFGKQGENKILLGGVDPSAEQLYLQIFDIQDLEDPSRINYITLGENKGDYESIWIHPSRDFAFFNTENEFKILRIADEEETTLFDITAHTSCSFRLSQGSQRSVLACLGGNMAVLQLDIGLISNSFNHFKLNAFKVLDEVDYNRQLAIGLSKEESQLFLARIERNTGYLLAYEIDNSQTSLTKLNSTIEFPGTRETNYTKGASWGILVGGDVVVVKNDNQVERSVLFAADVRSSQILFTKTDFPEIMKLFTLNAALAEDGKTLAFITEKSEYGKDPILSLYIVTLNNDGKSNFALQNFTLPFSREHKVAQIPSMKITQNSRFLCANRQLLIYNITDPSVPIQESSYDLGFTETFGFTLSQDEKVLYIFGFSLNGTKQLQVLDISRTGSPKLLSSINLSQKTSPTNTVELSPDGRILYLGFTNGMLMIDIQIPTQPALFGYNYFENEKQALKFTQDGKLFYAVSASGVKAFDITSQYIIYMRNTDFKIGGSYPVPLKVLKLDKNLKFDYVMKTHRFQKVSLFDNDPLSKTNSHSALPRWITFDKERSYLAIEPKSALNRGTYRISVVLSTQIQAYEWIGINFIRTEDEAKDLMLHLLHNGYIDNQGYVSENFDPSQEIWLDLKYRKMEKEIKLFLAQNYIEALAEFSVSPSLDLVYGKHLQISTLSKGTISVAIQLNQTNCNFLTKSYFNLKPPHIDNKIPLLTFEGPLGTVNEALKGIIIDLNSDLQSCDGTINVTDGINAPFSRSIPSISKYFVENKPPVYDSANFSIQAQLEKKQSFYTGLYSAMEFDKNTFKEENNLTLEYSLEMPIPGQQLPSWISLKGLSLMGTPPEQFSPLPYKFKLVAKNEFKSIAVPFALRVGISFSYGGKLAITYIGYLASFVGFIISLNKIYNIIARKYYRYPRSYRLALGEGINDNKIFPMSFIKEEMEEATRIWKQLLKRYKNDDEMFADFLDVTETRILNKEKIILVIKTLRSQQGKGDFSEADTFSRGVIQQLIINRIVMKQLTRKEERKTKEAFGKIKDQWMDLVTVRDSSPPQFIIKLEKLEQELSKLNRPQEDESDSSVLLMENQYNIDLLKNAIMAHAFDFQNLNVETVKIDVISHLKMKGRSLYVRARRLIQKDLRPFVFLNKREIGYGIEYVINNNTLHFSGRLTHDLKDNTIVVHLRNNRGRILKEIWLTGQNQQNPNKSYIENVSDHL